jgi:hypothetical protein
LWLERLYTDAGGFRHRRPSISSGSYPLAAARILPQRVPGALAHLGKARESGVLDRMLPHQRFLPFPHALAEQSLNAPLDFLQPYFPISRQKTNKTSYTLSQFAYMLYVMNQSAMR